MPRVYKLSRATLRLLYKIRHHKGHGIHSPFIFELITKVIEEKTPYYKYIDIQEYIDNNPHLNEKVTKYNKLAFRLTNYFDAENILEIGAGEGINTLFLTAPSKKIKCTCIETNTNKSLLASKLYLGWSQNIELYTNKDLSFINGKYDCIYINLKNYTSFTEESLHYLLKRTTYEKTCVIINGIRTNKKCQMLWISLDRIENRTAKLDLFHLGIIFFDQKLYKWNYQISF